MEAIFGIIMVLFIGSAIFNAIKKNPEVKKFFDEIKAEFTGNPSNSNNSAGTQANTARSQSGLQKPKAKPNNETKPNSQATVFKTIAPRQEMESQLTESGYVEYVPMQSRNQELGIKHAHPAESYGYTEEYDSYSGSLGVNYAGEGCEEHYRLRYVSDQYQEADDQLHLSTLQKLVVFGEVINTPVSKKKH